jgi:NADH-quinone oxidoreductase subunit A
MFDFSKIKSLTPPADDAVATLVFFLLVFLVVGVFFLFIHLVTGSVIRPRVPDPEKLTIYECGEPTVGSAWVQFDLRYYVVALLFVIFDVEVAFFFPWAVVFGKANQLANLPVESRTEESRQHLSDQLLPSGMSSERKQALGLTRLNKTTGMPEAELVSPQAASGWAKLAFFDVLIFFGVLLVGFAYLWRRGDIDWVRSVTHRGGEHPVGEPKAVA